MPERPGDRRLLARIGERSEAMLDLLAQSVRRPSESGWEDRVTGLYGDWLADRGWPVTRGTLAEADPGGDEPRAAERENLVAWFPRDRGLPRVVINGHVDVVPAGDEAAWTRPPYSGAREGGRVHGRGSVDTKGGIAAALFALAALEDTGTDLPFDVAVQLVTAEETSGAGTRAAAPFVPDPAAAIVLEPTGGAIVPVSTGLLFFTVEVTGVAAHTSAPWRGVDAFERLVWVRDALAEFARKRGETYRHPLFTDVPTAIPFAVGTVRAGTWRAAVPDHATMSGRIGVAPGESLEDVRREVGRVLAEVAAADDWLRRHPPTIRWDHEGLPGWETPVTHGLVQALRSAQVARGGREAMTGFTAGSDAAYFGARGVPTAVFGPGDVAQAHAPDESVAEQDVINAAEVLALTLTRLEVTG
ncbi:M20 family metallopeptidase [Actinomadura roseirufa]|uniref:M20 family metallopeptidase n=1 Tax=Actinomadura roseirufa TaxID=2094049 RepID=UPI0010418915|nr:ArgE/DapE family deacylase [Actinomadura roseirufa]